MIDRASAELSAADQAAVERILASRPAWCGIARAGEIVGAGRRVLLHAGPPVEAATDIPPPVRNSLAFACIYEGWVTNWAEADEALAAGEVGLLAAQDHGILVPLAGVVSPSMALAEVRDDDGRTAFAALNEGRDCASRLGTRDERLPDHHRWLNGDLADWLEAQLGEPLALLPPLRASLDAGDDGHAKTLAGSRLVAEALLERAGKWTPEPIVAFLHEAGAFALNLWMAAAACAQSAAVGIEGARVVTRAAGNGHRAGIQLAGAPGEWVTTSSPVPEGELELRHAGCRVLPGVGDSPIVDLFGLGGQVREPARAAELLSAPHPGLGGRWVVTSARRTVAAGRGPLVLLGMIESMGEAGRIGGGSIELPVELFR